MSIPNATSIPPETQENWRPVVGYEGIYEVSDLGRVKRIKPEANTYNGRILTIATFKRGYQYTTLLKQGKPRKHRIHRLVLAAFVGPIPEGYEVNHIDGNRANNSLSNLEYVTHSENERHAYRELNKAAAMPRGEAHYSAVLTNDVVHEIKRLLSLGPYSYREIARMVNVDARRIGKINRGEIWRHVT